jgi:hypothetical protein
MPWCWRLGKPRKFTSRGRQVPRRTPAAHDALLRDAGLRRYRIAATTSALGVIEAVPA